MRRRESPSSDKVPGWLFVESLLPEKARINLRGGKGSEFFCDGKNRPAKWFRQDSEREPGSWRIGGDTSAQVGVRLKSTTVLFSTDPSPGVSPSPPGKP